MNFYFFLHKYHSIFEEKSFNSYNILGHILNIYTYIYNSTLWYWYEKLDRNHKTTCMRGEQSACETSTIKRLIQVLGPSSQIIHFAEFAATKTEQIYKLYAEKQSEPISSTASLKNRNFNIVPSRLTLCILSVNIVSWIIAAYKDDATKSIKG